MVFEYTDAEKQQLMDVDKYYSDQLDKVDAEMNKHRAGTKVYARYAAEHTRLEDERTSEFSNLYDKFERERFDQLGGDPAAILENAKEQTELIIKAEYEGRLAYDIDSTGQPKSDKPLIESEEATKYVKRGLWLHFNALRDTDLFKELRDYIYKYIASSPYTYTDTHKDTHKDADVINYDSEPIERVVPEKLITEPLTESLTLSKYGYMKDKVARAFIAELPRMRDIDGQLRMLWPINQAKKEAPVPVYFALSPTDGNITTSRRIDAQDNVILTNIANCIFQLQQEGAKAPYNISPEEIWRKMKGIKWKASPTPKQKNELCDRIDKMRTTMMYMDISREIQAGYSTPDDDRVKDGKFEDYYLPARKITAHTMKGKEATAYQFYDMPFIYVYNLAKGHIVLVDYDLLDTSDTTTGIVKSDEWRVMVFRDYLLLEIQRMYLRDRNSNRIMYNTLYKATGTKTPEERTDRMKYKTDSAYDSVVRKKAADDRKIISALLDSWKKRKWILDYSQIKDKNTFVGIEIKLNPKKYEETTAKNLAK